MCAKNTEKDLKEKKPRGGSKKKKKEADPFTVSEDEIRFVTHSKNTQDED